MEYRTKIVISDKKNNLNGIIAVEVRNNLITKKSMVQPTSTTFFLTREGALQLITNLQHATLALDGVEDYLIHPEGSVHADGVYYNSVADFLANSPSKDLD